MAQAKVVKSRRGNDLAVVTFGPKELAKVIAVVSAWDEDEILGKVFEKLVEVKARMRKQYAAEVRTEVTLL